MKKSSTFAPVGAGVNAAVGAAVAAALLLAPALATASSPLSGHGNPVLQPVAQSTDTVTFDVSDIFSNDGFGSPFNEIYSLAVGAFSTIHAVGWNVALFADTPSWLSEMNVDFSRSDLLAGVTLTPGDGVDTAGRQTFSSNGLVSLVGSELAFQVGADGLLRLEFWESVVDYPGDWDGLWESGTLTFGVTPIPEPSTYALMAMGLLGISGYAMRRRRDH